MADVTNIDAGQPITANDKASDYFEELWYVLVQKLSDIQDSIDSIESSISDIEDRLDAGGL